MQKKMFLTIYIIFVFQQNSIRDHRAQKIQEVFSMVRPLVQETFCLQVDFLGLSNSASLETSHKLTNIKFQTIQLSKLRLNYNGLENI